MPSAPSSTHRPPDAGRATMSAPANAPTASRWWESAACRGLPTAMFFHPHQERGPDRRRRENNAIAVCRRCPVITACRTHAEWMAEPYGIWGGLTEEERLRAPRRNRSASTW